ncbi:MAG: MFS transporter [Chloroflexi bacterium]|nr:MFS transporter [Chloroflexota bacterium]
MQTRRTPTLPFMLFAFTAARTVVNTGYRMVYPFLPVIARGLGVELTDVALAITARSSLGLASPFLGSFADIAGRRRTIVFGLTLFGASLLIVGLRPTLPALFLSLILAAAGKLILDPAVGAYLGDRVPYARRGLTMALSEVSWSGAFLLGVPLVGWLIARAGWNRPFTLLALLGLACAFVMRLLVPEDRADGQVKPSLRRSFAAVIASRAAIAGLVVGLLISTSNEVVNIVFGAWLEQGFGLQVAALGAASAAIGVAELSGEGLVAGLTDRLGKRRAVALGIAGNALACLAIEPLAHSLPGALAGLFLFYITFEFALVSSIPLMSELVPGARATTLAGNMGSHSAGRAVGALIGPVLFAHGMFANAAAAAGLDAFALIILLAFVRE